MAGIFIGWYVGGVHFDDCLTHRTVVADSPIEIAIGSVFLYNLLGEFTFLLPRAICEHTNHQVYHASSVLPSHAFSFP
jgi:hypothetical protein